MHSPAALHMPWDPHSRDILLSTARTVCGGGLPAKPNRGSSPVRSSAAGPSVCARPAMAWVVAVAQDGCPSLLCLILEMQSVSCAASRPCAVGTDDGGQWEQSHRQRGQGRAAAPQGTCVTQASV